jgi:energy-coupling factor transport system permease protein
VSAVVDSGTRVESAVRARAKSELHPLTWAAWLGAGITMLLLTSNPLYIALIALSGLVVYASRRRPGHRALDVLLCGGVALALLTIPLNLVTGSTGATTLFDLPAVTLPGWLASVRFGGPVTAESLTYAATHALAIAGILALVCAFNASVDHFKLLKYTPPGLAQLGVIVTISLLLVPETLRRALTLRESRAVRGHQSGLRSIPGLLLPMLAEALERSVQRAESLDARGFGRLAAPPEPFDSVAAVASVGICSFSAFSYYYYPSTHLASAAGLVVGVAGVVAIAWRQARRSGATRLARAHLSSADGVIAAASLGGVGCFALSRVFAVGGVSYLPFPSVVLPQFHPLLAVACLLLLVPASLGHEEAP